MEFWLALGREVTGRLESLLHNCLGLSNSIQKDERDILVVSVSVACEEEQKYQMLCNAPNSSKLRERRVGAEDEAREYGYLRQRGTEMAWSQRGGNSK